MLTYSSIRFRTGFVTRWQAFRPNEDVDINDMGGGEYNVGYITAGEYLRYTVDVTKKSERHAVKCSSRMWKGFLLA